MTLGPIQSQQQPPVAPSHTAARTASGPDTPSSTGESHVFYNHLASAIQQNEQRKAVYAQMSGGATKELSDLLIATERISQLPALYFDWKAKGPNQRGIPVVSGDFVSMSRAKPPSTPPTYRGTADDAACKQLEGWLNDYKKAIKRPLAREDFGQVADLTYQLSEKVQGLERSTQSHFAMTRHIIDSVGYAAVNATRYESSKDPQAPGLWKDFIKTQNMALPGTIGIDRKAQVFQSKGIGIVVNDVPEIPFSQAYESLRGNGKTN